MSTTIKNKLVKKSTESIRYSVDLQSVVEDASISTIDSIIASPSSLSLSSQSIISVDLESDTGTIPAGKGIQFIANDGVTNTEYKITINITCDDANTYEIIVILLVANTQLNYYGSYLGGDDYFEMNLNAEYWFDATNLDKLKALNSATKAIDRLNFTGCKYNPNQYLQFPRGTDTEVPNDIEYATYEIAIEILKGRDIEMEDANLSAVSQGYSSARTTYDRRRVPNHIKAGILSSQAWRYLKPYLRDPGEIKISRVN